VVIIRECPGAIRVGKPLQLAVDDVAGTEATGHLGTGFNRAPTVQEPDTDAVAQVVNPIWKLRS